MDTYRVLVSLSEIEDNLYNLNQKITGVPPRFIFNLDEVGNEEFADSQEIKVIVLFNYRGNSAPYPIKRRERNSVLVCISANGFDCVPQIKVKRSTIENELYEFIPKDKIQVVNTKKVSSQQKHFYFGKNISFYHFYM